MNSYASGQLVTLSCTFTVSGVPTDPTTVNASIRFNTASATTYTYPTSSANTALMRDLSGVYHFDFVPVSAGTYFYRFQGYTSCVAAEEGSFDCASARF
jgi:hypothetical protein